MANELIQCRFCNEDGINVNGHHCIICNGTKLMRPIGAPTKKETQQ